MLLNVLLQIRRWTLKQVVLSVHLLGYIFWLVWPDNLQPYEALQRCWCFLQRLESAGLVILSCSPCVHTPELSSNLTHGNLILQIRWPWWPILCTATTNPSVWIYDSDTAWRPDWNEAALRHAVSTSDVFVEERSVMSAGSSFANSWRKYHLPDVAAKFTDQSVGHQWHHTTRLRRGEFRPRQLLRAVDLKGRLLSCQSY